ncbi:hypothetical protein Ddye_027362 [Dipteronia dyeriana]|uniref:TIR domain-containing protein n=1 Tax=Dipteronia dyeriana TaxID=168575 RepID=A0AAD9TPD9_9ROSI|nr:hypothetical protein Ddye_027362 [Dipteronia dyeriana]
MDYTSSITPPSFKYDVFISFIGEEGTRYSFTSHLYDALRDKQIEDFAEELQLPRREEIAPDILKVIEESKISVVIFSKDYAASTWHLDELVRSVNAWKSTNRL